MSRRTICLVLMSLAVAACSVPAPQVGADGLPQAQVYRITPNEAGKIEFRFLDSVNSLRQAGGVAPVALDPQLIAAAATHSRDMSVQNRPWHFGSDGSSPIDRVRRTGYTGRMLGENISETYETEIETLAAWMQDPATRIVVLDPAARDIGLGYYQDPNGKIWWTMVTASGAVPPGGGFAQF